MTTRREFLRTAGGSLAAASSAGARSLLFGSQGPQRPKFVLFLVDDMGWQDTSEPFYTRRTPFNDRYRTPNMERLARQGMKFTQAYACPVGAPLLRGQGPFPVDRPLYWHFPNNWGPQGPGSGA